MHKPEWEMTVPVISTDHAHREILDEPKFLFEKPSTFDRCARGMAIDGGWLVYMAGIRQQEGVSEWFDTVAEWFEREYPEQSWLRIDLDGDIIEDLQQYSWVPEDNDED